ncbi:SRPBCC family protein [Wenzhouxiangella limi]|uniref:SRPBCC family protein n=1 Tax=Wenzhouxiangella limi TaxID=2707351 RepID=UPI001945B698|nr:SRPBCC family protein [Wenzhouxiangella limi]
MLIRRVFAVLLALAILVVVVGFFLPRVSVVQRSLVIDQPAENIFRVLQDFRHFPQWSPWFERVPEAGFRLEGPSGGVGSTVVWSDEGGSGDGRLWITSVTPPRRVELRMELGETETAGFFLIEPAASGGERVTWGLRVEAASFDLVGRYMSLLLPGLVGPEYARGLERLASYLERHEGVPPVPAGEASDA